MGRGQWDSPRWHAPACASRSGAQARRARNRPPLRAWPPRRRGRRAQRRGRAWHGRARRPTPRRWHPLLSSLHRRGDRPLHPRLVGAAARRVPLAQQRLPRRLGMQRCRRRQGGRRALPLPRRTSGGPPRVAAALRPGRRPQDLPRRQQLSPRALGCTLLGCLQCAPALREPAQGPWASQLQIGGKWVRANGARVGGRARERWHLCTYPHPALLPRAPPTQ